jgi:prepilin-type N-terminal cleavage/methylation domain-containing protein
MKSTQQGYSAIELLATIAIVAILLSLALLSQRPILSSSKATAAARQVLTDLRLARSKALQHNTAFRVNFTANGTSYTVERHDPGSGTPGTWQAWGLHQRGTAALGTVRPIDFPSGIHSPNAYVVRFLPRGAAIVDSGDRIRLRAGTTSTSAVEVTIAGAVRITPP